jgi:hypothetical protein
MIFEDIVVTYVLGVTLKQNVLYLRSWRSDSVVQYLPSMREDLGSTPSTEYTGVNSVSLSDGMLDFFLSIFLIFLQWLHIDFIIEQTNKCVVWKLGCFPLWLIMAESPYPPSFSHVDQARQWKQEPQGFGPFLYLDYLHSPPTDSWL